MQIIVLRHATRKRILDPVKDEFLEKRLPLDPEGEQEATNLALELARRGIRPEVYFTSCFAHSKQTGEILRDVVGRNQPGKVVELCTLTPHFQGPRKWRGIWRGTRILEAIISESEITGNDLRELDVVALVLHRPRLQQLLASITPQDESQFENLDYSEGICLKADSLEVFLQGGGEEEGDRLYRRHVSK